MKRALALLTLLLFATPVGAMADYERKSIQVTLNPDGTIAQTAETKAPAEPVATIENLEVKDERINEKPVAWDEVVVVVERLKTEVREGKLTKEQAHERFVQWRASLVDDNRNPNDRMRSTTRHQQLPDEHRIDCGGQSERAERADGRDNERNWRDSRDVGEYRQPSELDSERHRSGARGQKLQHRPDSRQHREFRRGHKRTCQRCGKGTGKNRRGARGLRNGEHQSVGGSGSDRRPRRPSNRIRTVR
jgi:hypothetical protein